jgi:endonuclease YncB( thermonuclease family)
MPVPALYPYFAALLLLSPVLPADTLTGTVVKVVDGDTVYILDASKARHKIRLAGIDAPERRQAFGTKSKEYLRDLVAGEVIDVEWHKRDRYKRIVGKIIHAGSDVNLAMVNAGYAWFYRKYTREQSPADQVLYEAAEDNARATRAGLWHDPNPVPPWKWRRR